MINDLKARGDFVLLEGFQKEKKKKIFSICSKPVSLFPMEGGREKQVVSPSPSHGKLTVWLCKIRNTGVPHTSLEMSTAERIMDSGFRGDPAGHAF